MPYIPPEVVAKAKEMDLLTYLKITNRANWCILAGAPTAPEPTTA